MATHLDKFLTRLRAMYPSVSIPPFDINNKTRDGKVRAWFEVIGEGGSVSVEYVNDIFGSVTYGLSSLPVEAPGLAPDEAYGLTTEGALLARIGPLLRGEAHTRRAMPFPVAEPSESATDDARAKVAWEAGVKVDSPYIDGAYPAYSDLTERTKNIWRAVGKAVAEFESKRREVNPG